MLDNTRRPDQRLWSLRYLLACSLAGVVAALAGCAEDEIQSYTVRKPEAGQPPDGRGGASPERMLAAIVPHGQHTWFFKLLGPADAVAGQKEAFDRFIRSVRFDEATNAAPTWSVPEGWQQQPGEGMRYATLQLQSPDEPLELTVIRLGRDAGSLLSNVNRWRGQVGLGPIGEGELNQVTTKVELDGATATLVDLVGPGGTRGVAMRPFAPGRPAGASSATGTAAQHSPLSFSVPDGWQESSGGSAMRVAAFTVGRGDERAEVTVVPLPGGAGGLLSNVNRWRDQVGLRPVDDESLREEVRRVDIAGATAYYVELAGPESAGAGRKRILGAVLERGGRTWFFKMTGPAELVANERAAFETFLRSVRFEGQDEAQGNSDG